MLYLSKADQPQAVSDVAIVMSIQFIFVYAKVSEIALLMAPLSAALWLHIGHRRKLWPAATIALFFLFLPRRVVASLDIPILIHWRTGILLLLLCSLLWFSLAPVRAQSTQPYLLRK